MYSALEDRGRTEQIKGSAEALWLRVFEEAASAMLLFDANAHLVEANRAACSLLEETRDTLAGARFDELFPRSGAKHNSVQVFEESGEERFVRLERGKSVRWVKVTTRAGVLPGLHLCCCADVTELQELRREMERRNRLEAIGRVAGGVAHDFNNMLTAILSFTDLQLQFSQSNSAIQRYAASIQAAADRAAEITKQLLLFCRGQEMAFTPLDLNEVVRESAALMQRLIGEQICLELELAPTLPKVLADRTQLTQVLLNLAVNARDAMPEGGRLRFETCSAGPEAKAGHIVLRVQDSGTGIAPEALPHIFDPFFTTKAQGKGTGLGLATVRDIVTQNHGEITVQSERGRGTTFQITLPVCNAGTFEMNA